ncbi:hypothetical protein [Rhodococcus opacus]|uniref:hypothetical protein n=1 Tax=Rhodococcus opacus TaxID=37919 RepID=UPI002949B58B|nr:hypothetical protein [Rhodococcus opacus]MDV6246965.1 hypothetical protein [Rhodococcus opacus]
MSIEHSLQPVGLLTERRMLREVISLSWRRSILSGLRPHETLSDGTIEDADRSRTERARKGREQAQRASRWVEELPGAQQLTDLLTTIADAGQQLREN